jgi:hypothetical protein
MMISGPRTYRYVADGQLTSQLTREATSLRRLGRLALALAVVGLVLGIGASLTTYHASLSQYFGRIMLIGLVWGLAWFAAVAVLLAAVGVPLAVVINRWWVRRLFPEGSVTEVELGEDSLTFRRPAGTRSVPYQAVIRPRAGGSLLRFELRGRPRVEWVPLGLLPDDAIDFIVARARDAWPLSATLGTGNVTRQFTVPPGWAAHVAAAHTRSALASAKVWVRIGLALVAVVGLALVAGIGWIAVAPLPGLLAVAVTYERTRRAIATAMPIGSVTTSEFLDDRVIIRNARWAREIRFGDISTIDVRGDVVFLGTASGPKRIAVARALIPDDALALLRGSRPGTA